MGPAKIYKLIAAPHIGQGRSYSQEALMFWKVREFSASCINKLADKMDTIFLEHLMPSIEYDIMDAGCADWKESAILAFGLVAKHCMSSLGPQLSKLALALMILCDHPSELVAKTTKWTICCFKQIFVKVCPMIDIPRLMKWDPSTEFDLDRYFADWIELKCGPDYCKMCENGVELARQLDHITPDIISKLHDFVVLKLIWLGQTEDDTLPDHWMRNFGRYLSQRKACNVAPPQELSASLYFELNPMFSQETSYFLQLRYTDYNSDLVKTERNVLRNSLANEGKKRRQLMRLYKRVVVGLLILGICGNKVIDSASIMKFFLLYQNQKELRRDPTKLNESRKSIVNHIHEVPAADLWGFEVVTLLAFVLCTFFWLPSFEK